MTNAKTTIKYDDFSKLDIRVGLVTNCENVPKSDKLLKLEIDFGELGTRQILTGMAAWYKPEDFINKQFVFLINLEPRKMMGFESQGMLLSIGIDHEQKPIFINQASTAENGEGVS